MGENYGTESQPAPAGLEMTKFCGNELTRLNSDLPSLIAENYEDGSANATPLDRGLDEENKGESCTPKGRKEELPMDDCTAWTNERHNLYLNHLEVSFVKQLNQSMGFLNQCSDQNKTVNSSSQKQSFNVHDASDQFSVLWNGCWQKINYEKAQPLLHTSTGFHDTLESPWVHGSRKLKKQFPKSLKLRDAEKHKTGKRDSSQGLGPCSQCLASGLYRSDSFEFLTEGSGQNFVDEHCQNNRPNNSSRAKRLKRATVMVPCGKCPTVDNSAVHNSPLQGELAHYQGVPDKLESIVYPPA